MTSTNELNPGPKQMFQILQDEGPKTKAELASLMRASPKSVYNYARELYAVGLIKELPSFGRTKVYATIDYVPSIQDIHPIIQRWRIYSKKYNSHISLGEAALSLTHYTPPVGAPSAFAAVEFLIKAPAMLTYYAQINPQDASIVEINLALSGLRDMIREAIEHLESSKGIYQQLLTDPRLWDIEKLREFKDSPDYPSRSNLQAIIVKLQELEGL